MKATRDDKCADCDLAVVILSKNAAGYIARAVDDALTIVGVAEVLVIDDASTDSTVAKVQAISDPRVRCLASPVAFGIGATLRRGVGQLSSPFVLVLPAEVTLTGDQLQRVVDPCRSGSCDVVRVGVVGGTRRSSGASSRLRRALGQLSRPGLRRLTVTLVTALSSHAFEHLALHSDGPIITSELDARLAATDWNVLYVDLGAVAVVGDPKGRRPSIGALLGSVRYTPGAEPLPEMRDLVAFSTADAELACALDDLDAAAPNYADWIAALVEPFLGRDVLEVGAGHGTMSSRLSRGVRRVVATDVSPRCAEFLRARFAGDALIEPFEGEVAAASGGRSFDSAVLINVLEHVPDQESVLREIFEALRPGGAVVVYVPAFEGLYSKFDGHIGHVRRYKRSDLVGVLLAAGFEVADTRFVNAPGAVAWWIVARRLGQLPTRAGAARIYDRLVVPAERRLERLISPPFGQSLLCVGRRPRD